MRVFEKRDYVKTHKIKENESDINIPEIPDDMWVKCKQCGKIIYINDFKAKLNVCPNCDYHFRLSAKERISMIVDEDTFVEFNSELKISDPLDFPGYKEKLEAVSKKAGINEAVITGRGKIGGNEAIIAVMDSNFMMASMGCVVGEKITRAIEAATQNRLPIIIFTASGGARMQEGIFSLMQMAKTSAALAKHSEEGLLYLTVLTDPTTGGVTASFAMLGDIILSEPGTLIGFAGRRVIEQTIKEKLPDEFQSSEFLLKHGFIDKIVERNDLRNTIKEILSF